MLKLSIFGRFRAEDELGNRITIKSRKARAILAYLALPPGKERSREEIMALLWSDRGDEQARASLRQALSGLRRELIGNAGAALRITDDTLSLDPNRVIVEPASSEDVLLEGLHLNDPAFEEWLRDERLRREDAPVSEPQPDAPPLPDKPSIAVLPFTNMSGDPEQEYFSDGITEDIITELSRFRSLPVIARNSSFHYKGKSPKIQEVARDLGVSYVVEGSVRRSGNRVRITAQLVEVETGKHLWAERYDRDLEDVFAVQDEVTQAIVSTVAGRVASAGTGPSKRKHAKNLNAYDLVLRARERFLRYTKVENERARDLFEQATKLDPEYALAHVMLGWTHFFDYELGWSRDPDESSRLGLSCVRRGVELDSTDAWAHAGLAYGYMYSRKYDLGEAHIERATKLNPNDADILAQKGLFLSYLGRHDDGVRSLEMARLRNPFGQNWYAWNLGIALYTSRRYEEAVTAWSEMPITPTEVFACLAAGYAQLNLIEEARQCMARFLERSRDELADFPGEDRNAWRKYWFKSFPYKNAEDLENLLDGLRKAGLPV